MVDYDSTFTNINKFPNISDFKDSTELYGLQFLDEFAVRGSGYHITENNYKQVKKLLHLLKAKKDKGSHKDYRKAKKEFKNLFDEDLENGQDTLEKYKKVVYEFTKSAPINHRLVQFVQLSSEISTAQTADDVSNLISNYALPPASYRVKRQESFSIMLNAYVGAGGSYVHSDNTGSTDPQFIISAPIGLDFAWDRFPTRNKYKSKKNLSWSLFIPIFDFGNIIALDNFNDDNSEINFSRLVSPGAFITLSPLQKLPFTFGAGYQFNPNRFTITAAFDLPIYRIY
jgi:antitoxin component HigA of HigAB toxin-antitoxin module